MDDLQRYIAEMKDTRRAISCAGNLVLAGLILLSVVILFKM